MQRARVPAVRLPLSCDGEYRDALVATVFGDLAGRPPVLRSGARAGDVVAYIGRLGMAAAGLAVLSRGFRSPGAVVKASPLVAASLT